METEIFAKHNNRSITIIMQILTIKSFNEALIEEGIQAWTQNSIILILTTLY